MNRKISDERINEVMKRINKTMRLDINSDNEEERIAQLMILSIQEGHKEYILGLEKTYMDYSKLSMNDKFHCTKILDIIDSLDEKSKDRISRVILGKFSFDAVSKKGVKE